MSIDNFLRGVRVRKSAVDFTEIVKRVADELESDQRIALRISKAMLIGQSEVDRVIKSEIARAVKGEIPAGLISGDPILHDEEDEDDEKRKRMKPEEGGDEDDAKTKAAAEEDEDDEDIEDDDDVHKGLRGDPTPDLAPRRTGQLDGKKFTSRKRRSYGHDGWLNGD